MGLLGRQCVSSANNYNRDDPSGWGPGRGFAPCGAMGTLMRAGLRQIEKRIARARNCNEALATVIEIGTMAVIPVFRGCMFLSGGVSAMSHYSISINGATRQVEAAPDTPLLWVLRDALDLPGTKYGCGVGSCGACMVQLNGVPTRSCMTPVSTVGRKQVVTIEGLSLQGDHPLQTAWQELDVPQCGYCQSGQIMTAAALLRENPNPTDADIDSAMAGNLCRCATYLRIRAGIHRAAELAGQKKGVA